MHLHYSSMAAPSRVPAVDPVLRADAKSGLGWAWKREGLPEHRRFDEVYRYRMLGASGDATEVVPLETRSPAGAAASTKALRAKLEALSKRIVEVETALDSGVLCSDSSKGSASTTGPTGSGRESSSELHRPALDEEALAEELNDLMTQQELVSGELHRATKMGSGNGRSKRARTDTGPAAAGADAGDAGDAAASAGNCSSVLQIQQSRQGGICSTVWDSSIVLGRFFEREQRRLGPSCFAGLSVLELGAGCGLTGCVLGRLGADVVFSDLEPALPVLRQNAQDNLGSSGGGDGGSESNSSGSGGSGGSGGSSSGSGSTASGRRGRWAVVPLEWGREALSSLDLPGRGWATFDLILGADIMYVREAVPALVETLVAACGRGTGESDRRTEVWLAYGRNRGALADFLDLAAPHFDMEEIDKARLDPTYQSQDITVLKMTPQRPPAAEAAPAPAPAKPQA